MVTISTLVTGAASAVSAIVAATQVQPSATGEPMPTPAQTPLLIVAGVTAGVTGLTPLTGLIVNAFDADFSSLNQDQLRINEWLDLNVPSTGTVPASIAAPEPITRATNNVVRVITNGYGGRFGNDHFQPCVERLVGGTPNLQ